MTIGFNELLQKIEEIDHLTKTDWTGDAELYNKLVLVKPLCENRLKNVYADLLSQNDVNQLQAQLNNLISYIQTYKAGNAGYLNHVINTINAIVPIITKIPFVGKGETPAVFSKIIDNFSQKNEDIISRIMKEKEILVGEVEDIKKTISSLSTEIEKKNTEISSWQSTFLATQEKHSAEFTESQRTRDDEFFEAGKLYLAQFDKKEKERSDSFDAKMQEFSTTAKTTLAEMEKLKKDTADIYGLVGKMSMVGFQKKYADSAKNMAHWLQGASFICMLSVIGLLLYLFNEVDFNALKWYVFIYKLSIAAVLFLPAFYLANEAKKQRSKENSYRELEIKIAAIDPFLKKVGDGMVKDCDIPEKDRIKLDLAQKLLSPSEAKPDNNAVLSPDVIDAIKTIAEVVRKK